MPRLQSKNFATPDHVQTMPKVRFETVAVDDATVGHCTFEPGWRWSTDMGPMFGTPSCQMRHLGYTISGALRIVMDDGETLDIGPNAVFEVPPGHDKWVLGDEPWVSLDWSGSARAQRAALGDAGERALATVMFTDIVDSTTTLERMGDEAWHALLAAHNARLREELNVYRGTLLAYRCVLRRHRESHADQQRHLLVRRRQERRGPTDPDRIGTLPPRLAERRHARSSMAGTPGDRNSEHPAGDRATGHQVDRVRRVPGAERAQDLHLTLPRERVAEARSFVGRPSLILAS